LFCLLFAAQGLCSFAFRAFVSSCSAGLPSVLAASAAGVCQACKDPRFKNKSATTAQPSHRAPQRTMQQSPAKKIQLFHSVWAAARPIRPPATGAAAAAAKAYPALVLAAAHQRHQQKHPLAAHALRCCNCTARLRSKGCTRPLTAAAGSAAAAGSGALRRALLRHSSTILLLNSHYYRRSRASRPPDPSGQGHRRARCP
jgi:hypothetical protein